MRNSWEPTRSERLMQRTDRRLLLPVIAALHGGVLLLVVQSGSYAAAARPQLAINVSEVRVATSSPIAALEPVLLPVAVSVAPPPIDMLGENEARPVTIASLASGGSCTLAASIETSLRTNAAARAALERMPREARSVANAQMLWDGHWIAAGGADGPAALDPLRALVVDAVRAATPECRDATVTGPQLMFVADASGTRVLGFGSGTWSWSQLLEG